MIRRNSDTTEVQEVKKEYSCKTCGQTVLVLVKSVTFSPYADREPKFCPLCGGREINRDIKG